MSKENQVAASDSSVGIVHLSDCGVQFGLKHGEVGRIGMPLKPSSQHLKDAVSLMYDGGKLSEQR